MNTNNPNAIPQDAFTTRMLRRWREHGNYAHPADSFLMSWRRNNSVMNRQLASVGTDRESTWNVIEEKAGIGKSESIIVQCAEIGLRGHHGALIVVRLAADADKMADDINAEAGREVATAIHSGKSSESVAGQAAAVAGTPVVVLCHSSFENALKLNGSGRPAFWDALMAFDGPAGTRAQVIVDESLDVIEIAYLTESDIDFICERLTRDRIRQDCSGDVNALIDTYRTMFAHFATGPRKGARQGEPRDTAKVVRSTSQAEATADVVTDLSDFIAWAEARMTKLKRPHADRERVRAILNALNLMNRQFIVFERRRGLARLGTARCIIPEGSRGAIVMDATAENAPVYDLMKAVRHPATPGTRDHSNVTLHVGYAAQVGKQKMEEHGKARAAMLLADLNERLPALTPAARVLVTSHKVNRPHVAGNAHQFEEFHQNHYGQIDGSNQWAACNHVVHFGLHFRSDMDASLSFAAFEGTPDRATWFKDPTARVWQHYVDIKRAIENGWTCTAAVQTSTRGAARTVVDEHGHTGECHIWIQLPLHDKKLADALISAHTSQLPGLRVSYDWDWSMDGSKVRRKADHEAGLKEFIEHGLRAGTSESASSIQTRLGMGSNTWKRMVSRMRDPKSSLSRHAETHQVVYEVLGKGQRQSAQLRKL